MDSDVSVRDELAVLTAQKLYRWYANPSDDNEVLADLLPPEVMHHVFNADGRLNMALSLKRSMERNGWQRTRRTLLSDWGHLFEEPAEPALSDVWAFLRDCAGTINHVVFYNKDLVVAGTHATSDTPASDFITTYHGDRTAWSLHFTTAGCGRYVAGSTILTGTGDLLLISPKASLHFERDDSTPEWRNFWAMFQPESQWLDLLQWRMCTYGVYRLHLSDAREVARFEALFEELLELQEDATESSEELSRNLFEQLLIRAQQSSEDRYFQRTDPRVIDACRYIEDHLAEPLCVGDIASHCNISESRLAHLFQDNLEQGIKAFQASLRAQRAKRLLATTRQTIATIGAQVGYDDPAQFSKFFRKHLGCSPSQFRVRFSDTA